MIQIQISLSDRKFFHWWTVPSRQFVPKFIFWTYQPAGGSITGQVFAIVHRPSVNMCEQNFSQIKSCIHYSCPFVQNVFQFWWNLKNQTNPSSSHDHILNVLASLIFGSEGTIARSVLTLPPGGAIQRFEKNIFCFCEMYCIDVIKNKPIYGDLWKVTVSPKRPIYCKATASYGRYPKGGHVFLTDSLLSQISINELVQGVNLVKHILILMIIKALCYNLCCFYKIW